MTSTIVIYADPTDPVVLAAQHASVQTLHIDELIHFSSAQPWPEVFRMEISASVKQAVHGARIVNRLFSLDRTAMGAMLQQSGVDLRWLHIRLHPLLALGTSLVHDTGTRGVSRSLLPLNVQWFEIKRAMPAITTPEFAYSFGYESPDLSGLEEPMQKSVWSLFDWKQESQLSEEERRRHQFHVSAPKGVPIIFWFLGNEDTGLVFPRGSAEIDQDLLLQINAAARKAFCTELGEILLYTHSNTLRFQAYSPFLRSAASAPQMSARMGAWLATSPAPPGVTHAVV